MSLIQPIIGWFLQYRLEEVDRLKREPMSAQEKTLKDILRVGRYTEWGKKYGYEEIESISDFQNIVPINTYEDIEPYILKMMQGEENILCPGLVKWFAKSSGTTGARSKFIPIPRESLEECHFKGGTDELGFYIKNFSDTKFFEGKSLCVGGSISQIDPKKDIITGDVSAVIMKNLPIWAEYLRTPTLKTALLSDYEEKIEKLAYEAINENVTSIAGVPTWTALLIKKVLEKTGKKNIFEVWPNLEVFFHGAVSFEPYRELFKKLFPKDKMRYMEAYNASEGFFAIQDDLSRNGEMMLGADYGVFYEFILLEEVGSKNPKVLTMAEVEIGKNYALVISTNGGLARYMIGDTVMFTTLFPHRIKITGRTKHFMNAFGEEIIVENADKAISEACNKTDAIIREYTACPIFMQDGKRGGHEWIVEFERAPKSLELFAEYLDKTLRAINSDYDAKRYKDIAVGPPSIILAPERTFYNWMKSRGKLGGQHKVPRLSNTRIYVEDILKNI